jgi:hypothetical protein
MTSKAIVTLRGVSRSEAVASMESAEAENLKLTVEQHLPQGTLVSGTVEQYAALEEQGYRVKVLPDTNILIVGSYRIDIEADPPEVPTNLQVPKKLEKTWPHHLVQLAGPPNEEWTRAIEDQGVDVVEPISAYGLFVVGNPEQVSNLRNFPFVAWVGPFKPAYRIAPNLQGLKGPIQYLGIGVYPKIELSGLIDILSNLGAEIVRERRMPATHNREFGEVLVKVDVKNLTSLARYPWVRWLEYQPPMTTFGERETQIVAENLDGAPPPGTAPVTGYQAWLTGVSLNGTGVIVAICDTGVDANANNNLNGHTDLRGRQAAFVDYTSGAVTTDTDGHGTNVAGITIGNAATGQTEAAVPANFLWGQGMAPQSNYVTQNFLLATPQPAIATLIQDAVNNGAQVMNNSWGVANSGGSGYLARSRTIDLAVRDPNSAAAGLEYLVVVCAAGNEGGNNGTISAPHESKNDIVVGNSLTSRPGRFPSDDIRGISGTSGRGPAADGRILPTVVAPGTDVSAAFSRTSSRAPIAGTGVPDPLNPGNVIDQYIFMTGTSQSAPHVSGVCLLLIEWWRARTGGRNPSSALLKALLINGANDLAGGQNWRCLNRTNADMTTWSNQTGSVFRRNMNFIPAALVEGFVTLTPVASLANITAPGQWFFDAATNRIFVRMLGNTNPGGANIPFLHVRDAQPVPAVPNGHQGWGRVNLPNIILQVPTSDRCPKIFSDQRHAFTANGQEHMIRVAPVDTARPMRITLVWTDAPGAANANPALVNDLDLEVTELATGNVYRGNVFINGFSTTGGAFDTLNNIECVYIQNPSGTYEVRVIASILGANARPPFDVATPWQDFALVIDNAEVPAGAPVSVVPVIDRSGSMLYFGYENITRICSKQFLDLMGIDDQLGVVSFGDTGTVVYPTGAAPALQTINGQPIRDAAKAEVDGIVFGGCTFMGDGIAKARDLLSPAAGSRAMVFLSDGYDNKGCQPANPARPSAMDAVATLPANMPVFTCAMGPLSDQALLEQIANATNGRYYYMPTIDDLFEIYNYIRGQVTGDAIVANESALASSSRVAALVDALATEATFTVAWANTDLRFVTHDPKKPNEVSARLRDPRGRLLHFDSSYVRRTVGVGYVVFELQEPMAGQWLVEMTTFGNTHVRYTVGGFVRSPLRLVVSLLTKVVVAGMPLTIATQVFDGQQLIKGFKADTRVIAPVLSISGLQAKFKTQLATIKPIRTVRGDRMPQDISKLVALRNNLVKDDQPDIFDPITTDLPLKSVPMGSMANYGLGHLLLPGMVPTGPGEPTPTFPGTPVGPLPPVTTLPSTALSGVLQGQFKNTKQQGSYNMVVTASGISPVSDTRFVRKELVSVLVK